MASRRDIRKLEFRKPDIGRLGTPARLGVGLVTAGALVMSVPYVASALGQDEPPALSAAELEAAAAVGLLETSDIATDDLSRSKAAITEAAADEIAEEAKKLAKQKAAREKAAKEKAAREKAAREKAAAEKAAAEKAARERAAKEKAARAKARAAANAGGTPAQNRALGLSMCADAGFSASQCNDLVKLWERESSWNHKAANSSSGAYGIPQSLPGSKMASAGSDWRTNPRTQIKWGLDYIKDRYGNPSRAWAHSQSHGWY